MKTSIVKTLSTLLLITSLSQAHATKLHCPPPELVKSAKLIHAHQIPYDATYWNFVSATLIWDGNPWSVEFGTFFRQAKTEEEALKQGQAYFDKSPLLIPHPKSVKIINNITLCDYMPEGREYFISALNPPQ